MKQLALQTGILVGLFGRSKAVQIPDWHGGASEQKDARMPFVTIRRLCTSFRYAQQIQEPTSRDSFRYAQQIQEKRGETRGSANFVL